MWARCKRLPRGAIPFSVSIHVKGQAPVYVRRARDRHARDRPIVPASASPAPGLALGFTTILTVCCAMKDKAVEPPGGHARGHRGVSPAYAALHAIG
jgi:hypothetical protein